MRGPAVGCAVGGHRHRPARVWFGGHRGCPSRIIGHACFEPMGARGGGGGLRGGRRHAGKGSRDHPHGQLAAAAQRRGIRTFVAEVLAENRRMLEVFRERGFPTRVARDGGELPVTVTTELSAETLVRYQQRERVATAAAVRHFLEPDSVAVIGASRTPWSVGAQVLSNILRSSFEGRVFAVNREATRVQGPAAHPSVTELPEAPELAVPAEAVPGVARGARSGACARCSSWPRPSPRRDPRGACVKRSFWRYVGRRACGSSGRPVGAGPPLRPAGRGPALQS
jgi:hypothetical protein